MSGLAPSLAEQANREHKAAEQAARQAIAHAIECGRILAEAKRQVGHGGFGQWLADNFVGSDRTARAYMRLARELPMLDEAKRQRVAEMPIRQALQALAEPDEPSANHPPQSLLASGAEARHQAFASDPMLLRGYAVLLYEDGERDLEAIADQLGVSVEQVWQTLRPTPSAAPMRFEHAFEADIFRALLDSHLALHKAHADRIAEDHADDEGRGEIRPRLKVLREHYSDECTQKADEARARLDAVDATLIRRKRYLRRYLTTHPEIDAAEMFALLLHWIAWDVYRHAIGFPDAPMPPHPEAPETRGAAMLSEVRP